MADVDFTLTVSRLSSLEKLLKCPLCVSTLTQPITIEQCGHNFCRQCVVRHLSANTRSECPVCKMAIWTNNLQPNRQIDTAVNLISQLRSILDTSPGHDDSFSKSPCRASAATGAQTSPGSSIVSPLQTPSRRTTSSSPSSLSPVAIQASSAAASCSQHDSAVTAASSPPLLAAVTAAAAAAGSASIAIAAVTTISPASSAQRSSPVQSRLQSPVCVLSGDTNTTLAGAPIGNDRASSSNNNSVGTDDVSHVIKEARHDPLQQGPITTEHPSGKVNDDITVPLVPAERMLSGLTTAGSTSAVSASCDDYPAIASGNAQLQSQSAAAAAVKVNKEQHQSHDVTTKHVKQMGDQIVDQSEHMTSECGEVLPLTNKDSSVVQTAIITPSSVSPSHSTVAGDGKGYASVNVNELATTHNTGGAVAAAVSADGSGNVKSNDYVGSSSYPGTATTTNTDGNGDGETCNSDASDSDSGGSVSSNVGGFPFSQSQSVMASQQLVRRAYARRTYASHQRRKPSSKACGKSSRRNPRQTQQDGTSGVRHRRQLVNSRVTGFRSLSDVTEDSSAIPPPMAGSALSKPAAAAEAAVAGTSGLSNDATSTVTSTADDAAVAAAAAAAVADDDGDAVLACSGTSTGSLKGRTPPRKRSVLARSGTKSKDSTNCPRCGTHLASSRYLSRHQLTMHCRQMSLMNSTGARNSSNSNTSSTATVVASSSSNSSSSTTMADNAQKARPRPRGRPPGARQAANDKARPGKSRRQGVKSRIGKTQANPNSDTIAESKESDTERERKQSTNRSMHTRSRTNSVCETNGTCTSKTARQSAAVKAILSDNAASSGTGLCQDSVDGSAVVRPTHVDQSPSSTMVGVDRNEVTTGQCADDNDAATADLSMCSHRISSSQPCSGSAGEDTGCMPDLQRTPSINLRRHSDLPSSLSSVDGADCKTNASGAQQTASSNADRTGGGKANEHISDVDQLCHASNTQQGRSRTRRSLSSFDFENDFTTTMQQQQQQSPASSRGQREGKGRKRVASAPSELTLAPAKRRRSAAATGTATATPPAAAAPAAATAASTTKRSRRTSSNASSSSTIGCSSTPEPVLGDRHRRHQSNRSPHTAAGVPSSRSVPEGSTPASSATPSIAKQARRRGSSSTPSPASGTATNKRSTRKRSHSTDSQDITPAASTVVTPAATRTGNGSTATVTTPAATHTGNGSTAAAGTTRKGVAAAKRPSHQRSLSCEAAVPARQRRSTGRQRQASGTLPVLAIATPSRRSGRQASHKWKNAKGETHLHVAAVKGKVEEVQRWITAGCDVNVKDHAGWTPLHEAAVRGHRLVAELLLDNGALINCPGHDNDTALHDAVMNNHVDLAKLLVARGASTAVRNSRGCTPLELCLSSEMQKVLSSSCSNGSQHDQKLVAQQQAAHDLQTSPSARDNTNTVCIIASGLNHDEKDQVQRLAYRHKAYVVQDYIKNVTHVVAPMDDNRCCPRTIKVLKAILSGAWLVGFSWVRNSLLAGEYADEVEHEIEGTGEKRYFAPRKGRLNALNQLPGLFDGCSFYLYGDFCSVARDDLSDLILTGKGKLLSREPRVDWRFLTDVDHQQQQQQRQSASSTTPPASKRVKQQRNKSDSSPAISSIPTAAAATTASSATAATASSSTSATAADVESDSSSSRYVTAKDTGSTGHVADPETPLGTITTATATLTSPVTSPAAAAATAAASLVSAPAPMPRTFRLTAARAITVPFHARVGSPLAYCSQFILYDHAAERHPAKLVTPHLCTVSLAWLLDSISHFDLRDIEDEQTIQDAA
ncbi:mucin-5AC-like isoform X2 [Sycon ciliatum]|uniref:mucin-5AC-like isoform X2 n=1 Tax=Sycon ciliatum TaxID=27933 RepID=UPI0031F65569